MTAAELLRSALRMTEAGLVNLVGDMRDAPLTQPVERGGRASGNHPLWILGHLAYIEGAMRKIVLGEANPVERWATLFAPGTQPRGDASLYPSFDEVLRTFRELRAGTLEILDRLGDGELGRAPAWVPPGFEDSMRTVGAALLLLALHQMVHYGQIADARRAAGLSPIM